MMRYEFKTKSSAIRIVFWLTIPPLIGVLVVTLFGSLRHFKFFLGIWPVEALMVITIPILLWTICFVENLSFTKSVFTSALSSLPRRIVFYAALGYFIHMIIGFSLACYVLVWSSGGIGACYEFLFTSGAASSGFYSEDGVVLKDWGRITDAALTRKYLSHFRAVTMPIAGGLLFEVVIACMNRFLQNRP
jgi:hypothetical protein